MDKTNLSKWVAYVELLVGMSRDGLTLINIFTKMIFTIMDVLCKVFNIVLTIKIVERGFCMSGFTDLHCHILPALDDGAKSMEKTKEMLQIAYEEGIRQMIATPHCFASRKSASVGTIRHTIAKVEKEMEHWGFYIKLYPGNEIYYRSGVEELLEEGKINTLADSK